MKIIRFSYYDKTRNWGFENLEFLKLTLLVGASGVGKTQILRALTNIKRIANGTSLNGIKWDMTFDTIDGKTYQWKGEFEEKTYTPIDDASETEEKPHILWEQLISDRKEIIKRNENEIFFQGKKTVKLAAYQSALHLLKAEPIMATIQKGFQKIRIAENDLRYLQVFRHLNQSVEQIIATHSDIETLVNSNLSIIFKLLVACNLEDKRLFNSIKQRFIDIFPQVEDITVTIQSTDNMFTRYNIQIKEKGVEKWIPQHEISSGMLRSLIQISEIYLCPEGSVLLMDEFENSLGVNCIDELTNDILSSKRNIQFILTSHHPYIINNIPYQNWKIVTRKAGKVTVKNAADYRIGESKHDYFMQLLQLDEFSNGID